MHTVTCRTTGCGNEGIPIQVDGEYVDEEGQTQTVDGFACGVCGQLIADVVRDG